MTIDELIAAEPSDVRLCIDKIAERAGTYDADWNVIKSAAALLNEANKRETDLHKTVIHLQANYQREVKMIANALDLISSFGGTAGSHHKDWVIDQVTRALTGDGYDAFVAACCDGEDGPETYSWEVGIAP